MNLFRSEEHVRRWALFNPVSTEGLMGDRASAGLTQFDQHLSSL